MAWLAVALNFAKKDSKLPKKWQCNYKELSNKIIEVHQNILDYIKENWLSENSKKYIDDKINGVMNHIDEFKDDAQTKIEELKKKGIDKKSEIEAELKKLYEEKKVLIEDAKETLASIKLEVKGIDYVKIAKENLEKAFEEIKEKISK